MSDFNPRILPFSYTSSGPDQLSKLAYELLPPSNPEEGLPDFWIYNSPEDFCKKFKHLGMIVWSRRNSYHLLFINGHRVVRMWTTDKHMRAEMCPAVTNMVGGSIKGVVKMRSPNYDSWVQIRNTMEIKTLITAIKCTYGV